jgi:hypothetical protein
MASLFCAGQICRTWVSYDESIFTYIFLDNG